MALEPHELAALQMRLHWLYILPTSRFSNGKTHWNKQFGETTPPNPWGCATAPALTRVMKCLCPLEKTKSPSRADMSFLSQSVCYPGEFVGFAFHVSAIRDDKWCWLRYSSSLSSRSGSYPPAITPTVRCKKTKLTSHALQSKAPRPCAVLWTEPIHLEVSTVKDGQPTCAWEMDFARIWGAKPLMERPMWRRYTGETNVGHQIGITLEIAWISAWKQRYISKWPRQWLITMLRTTYWLYPDYRHRLWRRAMEQQTQQRGAVEAIPTAVGPPVPSTSHNTLETTLLQMRLVPAPPNLTVAPRRGPQPHILHHHPRRGILRPQTGLLQTQECPRLKRLPLVLG